MATSSVAAALALPELVAAVDSFNELLPGVPSTPENLQPLLNLLIQKGERGEYWALEEPACHVSLYVAIQTLRSKKTSNLRVVVRGPIEPGLTAPGLQDFRTWITSRSFPVTVDGLAETLAWAKDLANRLRSEDFCPRCRRDGWVQQRSPCKKLRARPLPMCEECAFEVALGAPPEKRARRE